MQRDQVYGEIDGALDDVEALIKNPDVGVVLTEDGVNTSLALVAVHAVRSYLHGKKAEAAEDFATAAEEIRTRMEARARGGEGSDDDGRGS